MFISEALREALAAYNRDDQTTHAAVLERLGRRLHRGTPEEAFVIVYTDDAETTLDVDGTAKLMQHWMTTANSSAWTKNETIPVYRVGEARRKPRVVVRSEQALIANALKLADSGVRATDPDIELKMPGFDRRK